MLTREAEIKCCANSEYEEVILPDQFKGVCI